MRKRNRGRAWAAAAAGLGLVWLGCDDSSRGPTAPSIAETECGVRNTFNAKDFRNSEYITNVWFPLKPGRVFILDGTANRGGGVAEHRVVFTVSDMTKVIDGVTTVVMWDRDYSKNQLGAYQLAEVELAFFAQDVSGNVWCFGEYPEEYERGEFLGAPNTWIVGQGGAVPGIHMVGNPTLGTKFMQGWAPEINFLDCAVVYAMGERTCVPFNCFENVLITDETSPLEVGGAHQRKYYAPGWGIVRVGAVDDPEAETLTLTDYQQLGPDGLAAVRDEVVKLDQRGYLNSDLYRRTQPVRRGFIE